MSVLGCVGVSSTSAAIIVINPSKDNTLYEYGPAEGDHSNGAGFHFFAGENAMGELRRGVLAFDVAGAIPAGSTITAVSLTMNMSMTPAGAETVELRKLLADWGEGTSHAPMGKVTERQLHLTMRRGDTAFSTQFFGPTKEAIFRLQSAQVSRSTVLDSTRGAQCRWLLMCNHGWTIRPATLAGWCWETKQPPQRRSGSTLEKAQARLC